MNYFTDKLDCQYKNVRESVGNGKEIFFLPQFYKFQKMWLMNRSVVLIATKIVLKHSKSEYGNTLKFEETRIRISIFVFIWKLWQYVRT